MDNEVKLYAYLKKTTPFIIASLAFLIMVIGAIIFSNYKKEIWRDNVISNLSDKLITKSIMLEKALYYRTLFTKSIAAYVSFNPNITNSEFHNLAGELIKNDSVISTMALSKDCVINAIFPEKGHEAAIGLNLLSHSERVEIVEKTIETHKSFIAGPVKLVEGGIAFITYTPIFDKTSDSNSFWGVTDVVISRDKLLKLAGIHQQEDGMLYAIRGYNGKGNNGAIWWGNKEVFDLNPLTVDVVLPNGKWIIAVIPEIGWSSYLHYNNTILILLITASLVISILILLVSRAILKIRTNEQELKAIFQSMDSLIIEFDNKGRYIKIPPINSRLLVLSNKELINKSLFDILPEKEAIFRYNAILACLKNKELIEYEYSMQIGNNLKWFFARISWKSEHRVIFHTFDITEQKNTRDKILKSEKELQELNVTKDKLFSIIAHDLKSPFNTILGYASLLKDNYDDFNEEKRKYFINVINKSSRTAFKLLENLLLWALSQQGKISITPNLINLKQLVNEATGPYISSANNKEISFSNSIPENYTVNIDIQTIKTVIANLFNNSVKFTPNKGHITIDAAIINQFIEVCISDNGVGIAYDVLPKIFMIGESISTLGTNEEKGTGLGLSLCKEFVEKNGGEIWVESKEGIGSKFCFTIPTVPKTET